MKFLLLFLTSLSVMAQPIQRNPVTTNIFSWPPADGWFLSWSNSVPVWTLNGALLTNLPSGNLADATNNDLRISNILYLDIVGSTNGALTLATNNDNLIGLNATNNDTVVSNGLYTLIAGSSPANKVSTNDARDLVLTGVTNNLGGDVTATNFWGDGYNLTDLNLTLATNNDLLIGLNGSNNVMVASNTLWLSSSNLVYQGTNALSTGAFTSSNSLWVNSSNLSYQVTNGLTTGAFTPSNTAWLNSSNLAFQATNGLTVPLAQFVTTNDTRSLVWTSATNNLGTNVSAVTFWGNFIAPWGSSYKGLVTSGDETNAGGSRVAYLADATAVTNGLPTGAFTVSNTTWVASSNLSWQVTNGLTTGAFTSSNTTWVNSSNLSWQVTNGLPPTAFALSFADVLVVHTNGTTTTYTAAASTDVGRGNALTNAIYNRAAGDVIYLNANTYDCGTNALFLNTAVTGVSLIGAGKYSTILKTSESTAAYVVIPLGNSSLVSDLSIIATQQGATFFTLPIGNSALSFTNGVIRNVYVSGNVDCIYISHSDTSCEVVGCNLDSHYDCVLADGTRAVITFRDCVANAVANANYPHYAFGMTVNDATVNAYDYYGSGTGGDTDNAGFRTAGSGTINIFGGEAISSGTAAADLKVEAGAGTINVSVGTVFTTKSGTPINVLNTGLPYLIVTNGGTSVITYSNAFGVDETHYLFGPAAHSTITNTGLFSADAVATDARGKLVGATAISMSHITQPGVIMTNGGTTAITYSNAIKIDAAHSLSLSNATASHVLQIGADSTVSSVATGAAPIDGNGAATTFAQIDALAFGTIVTNGETTAITVSNTWTVDATHTLTANGPLTVGGVSTLVDVISSGTNTGNFTAATNNVVWKTANYTLTAGDTFVFITGAHTTTMPDPTAKACYGKWFYINVSSAGTNAILPSASETFNGSSGTGLAKLTNTAVGKLISLYSNRTNWWYVINP